ncbi:hypothetical protein ABPG72_007675 [Tetrahymena utriculariae]
METNIEFNLEDYVDDEQSSSNLQPLEDQEQKVVLKYGHTIHLQLSELSDCSLTTNGFMNPKLFIEKISFSNQDKALFMIYPSFNTSNLDKLSQLPLMRPQEKKNFEKRVIDDYKQNLDIFEKMKGLPVVFDTPLQLLNINTNKFLSCNYQEAEEERQNFKLELQNFSSKNTLFKIVPSYIHQDQKDGVVFSNDVVFLVSAEKYLERNPYIQCNTQLYKKYMQSVMTSQHLNRQSFFQISPSIIKKSKQENELPFSSNQIAQKFDRASKMMFVQAETKTTVEMAQDNNSENKFDITKPKPLINNQNNKNSGNLAVQNNQEDLNQSSELKSGQENNQNVHETIRPNQVHKFKKEVDLKGGANQATALPFMDNPNIIQLNNQNIIPVNPSPVFPQSQFQDQPLTLNKFEENRNFQTEVNVSLENKTKWVIKSYCEVHKDEEIIKYGDKIWLHHLETANNIVTQRNFIMKQEIQKQFNLENDEHKQDQNRYRQCVKFETTTIKDSTFSKHAGNTKGIWIIERKQKLKGGHAEFKQIVFFKHFSSRKYLQLVKFPCGKDQYAYYFDLADEPNLSCSFVLIKLPSSGTKNQKYITKESFFYLKSVEFKVYINVSFRKGNTNLEEYLGFNQGVDVSEIQIDEAAFKLDKATNAEVLETYFLTQCLPILSKNLDTFQMQQKKSVANRLDQKNKENVILLNQLEQTIEDIKLFCLNQIILTSIENQRNYSKVSFYRQKIVQEQYIIDELIEILKCIVKESDLLKLRNERKQESYKKAQIQFSEKTLQNIERLKKAVLKQKGINLNLYLSKFGKMSFVGNEQGKAFFFAIGKFEEDRVEARAKYLQDKIHVLQKIYGLLTIVIKDNTDNVNLIYRKLTSFQNHAAYIKEAADFVISIVSQNETILSNLSDDIKITESLDNLLSRAPSLKMFFQSSEYNNKRETFISPLGEIPRKPTDNLLLFFKENAITQHKENLKSKLTHLKDPNILNFFRNICKFQGKGVSVNQEQIHKFCYENEVPTDFYKSLFYKLEGEEKRLKLDLNGRIIQIASQKDLEDVSPEIYAYVIDQINLCADLCLTRNYLWKKDLKGFFPVEFVFKVIFDNSVDEKLRSAFCNLARSLYVDHEPLNKKQVPNMCRIFRGLETAKKLNKDEDEDDHNDNIIYAYTIDKIIRYINQQYLKLRKSYEEFSEQELNKKALKSLRNQGGNGQENQNPVVFDDGLTLDIIKMLTTFVKFDILALLKQQYMYRSIVTTLLQLLEYDKNQSHISFVVQKVRQERFNRAFDDQNKNKLLSNFTGFIVNASKGIAQAGKEIAGEVAGIVGAMIGVSYAKSSEEADNEQFEATNSLYAKNPMIGGLVTLKSMFQKVYSEKEDFIEVEMKTEICELFIFQQNSRMDFLITNFLCWYDQVSKKYTDFSNKKVTAEIEEDIPTIIPELYKTGVDEIEMRIMQMTDNLDLKLNFDITNMTNMLKLKKKKKFQNYTSLELVLNLDSLLEGDLEKIIQKEKSQKQRNNWQANLEDPKDPANAIKQEVLPSLLFSFYMTKNYKVEDKVIEVLRNCFNQTNILFDNLYNLEVLFDQRDVVPYILLDQKIAKLRQFAEESEVWLTDFLRTQQVPDRMKQTQIILNEINELFYYDLNIVDDKIIIPTYKISSEEKQTKRQIDKVRQKVFTFLQGHDHLIQLVKDTQNQMAKLLKSKNVSNPSKYSIYKLLSSLYKCLTLYCDNYEENQFILSKYTGFFLDEIQFDFGQLDLVCSIYKNNKSLCESFSDNIANVLINNITYIGRQPRFLKLFKIILSFKEKSNRLPTNLIENQMKVIHWFLPKDNQDKNEVQRYQQLLYCTIDQKNKQSIQFKFEKSQEKSDVKLRDVPYHYHAELLDLFLQSVKGDESSSINTSKLKKVFPQSYILDLLMKEDSFVPTEKMYQTFQMPKKNNKKLNVYIYDNTITYDVDDEKEGFKILKPKLIDFLLAIYFNEDKPYNDALKDHKRFYQLCEMEYQRLSRQIDQFPQDYIHYICGKFLKTTLFYFKKVILRENQQDYKDQDEYKILYNISTRLFEIRFQFDELLNRQEFQDYAEFMKNINEQCYNTYIEQINAAQMKPDNKKNEYDEENKLLWKAQYNWKIFLSICRNSDLVKQTIETEISILAESILKIKDMFPEQYKKQFKIDIQYQDIIKKLIQYLYTGLVNQAHIENMIFIFNLLEQMLNDCEEEKQLEETQNLFDSLDATKMCLHLLSDSKKNPIQKKELLDSILKFMIKLLEGGNLQVQKTIFDYFMTYPESEVIFHLFYSIINDYIQDVKDKKKQEIIKIQNDMLSNLDQFSGINQSIVQSKRGISQIKSQSQNDEVLQSKQKSKSFKQPLKSQTQKSKVTDDIDNESILQNSQAELKFDDDKDPHRKQIKMINSHILMKVLRVLQLFCEGHNINLQNYIRYQTNSRNKHDMVTAIIDLLYIFYDNIDEENFSNMLKCLDTLIEFVQGPCIQNQNAIIDSKFFQFAEEILEGYDQKKHEKKRLTYFQSSNMLNQSMNSFTRSFAQRSSTKTKTILSHIAQKSNTQLKPWMLEQIKYKTMILVTSLLEMNSEPQVIKRIMRSLPLEVLRKNLIQVYRKHKKLYQEQYIIQCFGHHEDEPPEDASEKQLEFYNYIIETGFFIFFLLSYYIELDEKELDIEISTKLNEIKKDFNDSKSIFSLRKGMITQLYNLVYGIIDSILDIFKGIGNEIKNQITSKNEEQAVDYEKQMREDNQMFKQALAFFNKNSGSIEIVRDRNLERIRFILLPYCHYLPKQTKVQFHDEIDRDSIHTKLSDLVKKAPEIIEICKHEEQLSLFFNRNKFIGIFANSVDLWRDIAFMLTILINIFILVSYGGGEYSSAEEKKHNQLWNPSLGLDGSVTVDKTEEIFRTTGIIMIVCSMFVVLFFLCQKAPLYLKRAWESQKASILQEKQMVLIKYTKYFIIILTSILKVLTNPEVIYYLMYGTLAFIATYVHPFFFSFHLTECLLRFPTLRNILKSVSDSYAALILTFVLIIMLFYFQAVIAFFEFYQDYNNQCDQLYLCLFHTFLMTFQNNGGIGGYLESNVSNLQEDGHSYDYSRFIFDNISFFSVMLISVQIFSGVIIDKFSYLREKEYEKNEDIFQKCFICEHSRELFERQSDFGFEQHIKQDHYLWNYVFYLAYLGYKDKTDQSGIESYIQSQIDEGSDNWFPIEKALILKDNKDEDQEEIERKKSFKIESDIYYKQIQDVLQNQQLLQEIVQTQKQYKK